MFSHSFSGPVIAVEAAIHGNAKPANRLVVGACLRRHDDGALSRIDVRAAPAARSIRVPPEHPYSSNPFMMYRSHASSSTPVSLRAKPRTEMPASCTVSAEPDTSGCHHASPRPSAMRR